jgi:molybdenum cofactor guanylyltransferase
MAARVGGGTAGVVLAGGRSSRMGTAKAALEWHGSTLLRRTLGVLARAVDGPLLVVRAPGQPLPELPPQVEVVDDPEEGLGPLQGLAAGLAALRGGSAGGGTDGRAGAAFVCATDLPFLHPAFVRRVRTALADGTDVVLPVARGHPQPLAAAYRPGLAPLVAGLVAAGELRPAFLFRRCRTTRLDDAALLTDPALAAADPALARARDHRAAFRRAGRPRIPRPVHRPGRHAGRSRRRGRHHAGSPRDRRAQRRAAQPGW